MVEGLRIAEQRLFLNCHLFTGESQPNTFTNPANRHAREIVNQYKCKVKKLDIMFAASVVGDGNNNVVGPFENALTQFHGKTIIPLCFGAFQ